MLHRAQRDISDYSKDTRPLIRHEATYSLNTRPRGESVCSVFLLIFTFSLDLFSLATLSQKPSPLPLPLPQNKELLPTLKTHRAHKQQSSEAEGLSVTTTLTQGVSPINPSCTTTVATYLSTFFAERCHNK